MKRLSLLFLALCFTSLIHTQAITVYTIGDSTMASKKAERKEWGWGMAFQSFFDESLVTVENHAANGRSSKSFIDENRWTPILDRLQAGDYVFIQFGHNDEKEDRPELYTDPNSSFREYLSRYVNETRDKGAYPILLTPIVRRHFDEDGLLLDSHGKYPDAVRETARKLNVPLIDMEQKSRKLVQELGVEASKKLFMISTGKNDNTHFVEAGARAMAHLVVEGIIENGLVLRNSLKGKTSLTNDLNQPPLRLWYDKPAEQWMTSALPLGNGEQGAMFFGGVEKEQIQFNEKTLWQGSPDIRGAYQNFGDLFIDFPEHSSPNNYRRELDIDRALGLVSYSANGNDYLREYFVSNPDSVLVMRLSSVNGKGKLNLSIGLKDAHPGTMTISGNQITMQGQLDLLAYEAQVCVLHEGGILSSDTLIVVRDADAVTILLTAGTNYDIHSDNYTTGTADDLSRRLASRLERAIRKPYEQLKADHVADYKSLFDRVKLDFGVLCPEITTDSLIRHRKSLYLDILYFQYGRYLMISSSRGVDLPSNLQGIWNNSNNPPWQSDIHTNINVQMNYWPAENTNLSACHRPFLHYIHTEAMRDKGSFQQVAENEGLPGWAVHTQSTIFGHTDWNINRPANAWYCMHLYQHYLYGQDEQYLREIAYPVMRRTCEYWMKRLVLNEEGQLVAPDEWSPEQGPWQDGVAYAQQLIWELFNQSIQAARLIGEDRQFLSQLEDTFSRLDNGLEIGDWGQIKEWKEDTEGLDTLGNRHRHLSQLVALYPGNQVSYYLDARIAEAAKKTLRSRGDGATGWSRAWKIACWARLLNGDHAHKLLKEALNLTTKQNISTKDRDGGVYENLLDAHPPFQIDGNFGATAGIAEMILQSHLGYIHLLPALPSAWPSGKISGLRAIGNFEIHISWQNSRLLSAEVLSLSGKGCRVFDPDNRIESIQDRNGEQINFQRNEDNTLSFLTEKGVTYLIKVKGNNP